MRTFAIVMTGSQGWKWPDVVHDDLDRARAKLPAEATLLLMHGDCDRGADSHGRQWARRHRDDPTSGLAAVDELPFPADWTADCTPDCNHGPRRTRKSDGVSICQAAGQHRNLRMIQDAVRRRVWGGLAYILDMSPGSTRTLNLMLTAQINVDPHYRFSTGPRDVK
jgi:hypothetical protein